MPYIIPLVQGNNLPYVDVVLVDRNNNDAVIDVSAATSVSVKFRAAGTTTVLTTITCSLPNGGGDGLVRFNFPDSTLDVDPGPYQGEIECDFSGLKQTVYEVLYFTVRAKF